MPSASCAFSVAQPLLLSSRASYPSSFTPRRIRAVTTPKRPRSSTFDRPFSPHVQPTITTTPVKTTRTSTSPRAQFNQDNDRNARIRDQAADFLLTAGRFFQSTSGQVFLWGGLVWLVLTGRIGILFDSFLILFAFLTIVPVVAMLVFRWWVSRQLVKGMCPNCGADVTGLKGQSVQCTSCGNTVVVEPSGSVSVKDPSSATIDIDARQVDDY